MFQSGNSANQKRPTVEVVGGAETTADTSTVDQTSLMESGAMNRQRVLHAFQSAANHLVDGLLHCDLDLHRIAALPLPGFADACLIDVLDENGRLERLGEAFRFPISAIDLGARPPSGDITCFDQVLGSGQSSVVAGRPPTDKAAGCPNAIHLPMKAAGRVRGVFTLMAGGRPLQFNDAEQSTFLDLADRIAVAVENRRLYRQTCRAVLERDDLLTFVSHDLHNLLSGILLTTQLLTEKKPALERRRGWTHLDRILRGAQHMRRMVDDLLDLSSLESGHFTLRVEDTELGPLLAEAADILLPAVRDRRLRLEINPVFSGLRVRCDPERTIQVLANIVGNAVKFTPEGGLITMSAAPSGGQVVVSVRDTGPGVEPARLSRIFERYWQAEAGAQRGRGLGLYISKGIVEAQQGAIWANSRPGAGMTVAFSLPSSARRFPFPALAPLPREPVGADGDEAPEGASAPVDGAHQFRRNSRR